MVPEVEFYEAVRQIGQTDSMTDPLHTLRSAYPKLTSDGCKTGSEPASAMTEDTRKILRVPRWPPIRVCLQAATIRPAGALSYSLTPVRSCVLLAVLFRLSPVLAGFMFRSVASAWSS